ncbi:2-keto-3-deoxygluconate permease [Bordetella pertussis]|uniref:2-keto-3-deoxygluconate permease n=1 Tax=Bordetella pertussis TaxID=520 RepID=UPI0028ECB89D|nr:2-keto-3-deoxygluconate permease [Bordetella pertussis]WNR29498.1 2-keto-3-deoxygluconate permease [Bordetella pertussis]
MARLHRAIRRQPRSRRLRRQRGQRRPVLQPAVLGASGLADIPTIALVAALVPFLLGVVVGNLGHRMAQRAQAGAKHR